MERLRAFLGERVPAHSLAALRILFGALMLGATLRFAARGWIDSLYVEPSFHFTYWGFHWVHPLPAPWIYLHFALLGCAAVLVLVGLFTRASVIAFFLLFTWVELLDVTTYLNHYYAISLVALLLAFVPCGNVLSLDALAARRRGQPLPETTPRAAILLFQAQLAIIYFFAGLAKLEPDWLLRGEPMTTWLLARTELPVIGPLLALPVVPLVMSWMGALFDLTIPLWLSFGRTRPWAYVVVVVFHIATWWLFPIGMFPWVMIGLTPIFFAPDWPLRLLERLPRAARRTTPAPRPGVLPVASTTLLMSWLVVQALMPLRHYLYPGDVLWTEEGIRYAWQVMIVERDGTASFRVVGTDGRTREVDPRAELTPFQSRMMATQPDLILQYAHHLAERERVARPGDPRSIRVYADVFVAANGRPNRRLVDPTVDLAHQSDTVFGYPWLLPGS